MCRPRFVLVLLGWCLFCSGISASSGCVWMNRGEDVRDRFLSLFFFFFSTPSFFPSRPFPSLQLNTFCRKEAIQTLAPSSPSIAFPVPIPLILDLTFWGFIVFAIDHNSPPVPYHITPYLTIPYLFWCDPPFPPPPPPPQIPYPNPGDPPRNHLYHFPT